MEGWLPLDAYVYTCTYMCLHATTKQRYGGAIACLPPRRRARMARQEYGNRLYILAPATVRHDSGKQGACSTAVSAHHLSKGFPASGTAKQNKLLIGQGPCPM